MIISRMTQRLRPEWFVLPVLLTLVATTFGGFELRASRPSAAALDDAVLLVRAYGCAQPTKAEVAGTAEGLINGERLSIPLDLEAVDQGVYAVRQQWPVEGTWVLAFTGRYGRHDGALLVNVTKDGHIAQSSGTVQADILHRKLRAADVESRLAAQARHAATGR